MNVHSQTLLPAMPESDTPFKRFCKSYPSGRIVYGVNGIKILAKALTKTSLENILQSVELHKQTDQWKRGIIPLSTTYLNQERWQNTSIPPPPPPTELSPMMLSIKSKELDRLLLEIQRLKNSYSDHQTWTPADRAEMAEMIRDKKALKALLGLKY